MTDNLYWHFLPKSRKMQYPPHTLVEAGKTYRAVGRLVLCENGMHASKRAIDALKYAPGDVVCRVQLSGEQIDGDDKACARERHVIWLADASPILHEFACFVAQQALDAEAERGRTPDPRSYAAIAAKRAYLRVEIDADDLNAAWSAVESAARSAAESAAWSAAESAARSAAWSAVESAARSAAWSAVESAARSAVESAAESAARSAAWSAAQNAELERLLLALAPTETEVTNA